MSLSRNSDLEIARYHSVPEHGTSIPKFSGYGFVSGKLRNYYSFNYYRKPTDIKTRYGKMNSINNKFRN